MPPTGKTLMIGISGVSSSGKTTLARLLRDIWPRTFILHEDDFYWEDNKIPIKNGVADWDCLESIDIATLQSSLGYIKDNSTLPPNLESKEDQNSVGDSGVDKDVIHKWQEKASQLCSGSNHPPIAIIDGFLLYSKEMKSVWELLDLRLLLRTTHKKAKARREARSGYVTLEGFWEDPPGYVDKVVWPNYVKDHSFLFVDGNVEGLLDEAVCSDMAIEAMPLSAEDNMTKCLDWACRILERKLKAEV